MTAPDLRVHRRIELTLAAHGFNPAVVLSYRPVVIEERPTLLPACSPLRLICMTILTLRRPASSPAISVESMPVFCYVIRELVATLAFGKMPLKCLANRQRERRRDDAQSLQLRDVAPARPKSADQADATTTIYHSHLATDPFRTPKRWLAMANLFSIAGAVGPRFQLPVRPRIGLVTRSSSVGLRLLMSRSGRLGPGASSLSQAGSPAGRHSYPHRAFHHSPVRQDVVFLAIPVCRMVRSCEKLRSGELTRRPGPPSVGAQVSPADGDKGDARHATFCLAVEVSRSWASSSDLK